MNWDGILIGIALGFSIGMNIVNALAIGRLRFEQRTHLKTHAAHLWDRPPVQWKTAEDYSVSIPGDRITYF